MKKKDIKIGDINLGENSPVVLIAGPCVIESRESALRHAKMIKAIADKCKIPFIFKASYDKANRSSIGSYRGPGIDEGLDILGEIKKKTGVPVLSDIHETKEIEKASKVLDVLQIPAFLCRQTDLLIEAGKTGKTVNVKKGQFMSPREMDNVVKKIESTGNKNIMLTERGSSFGYNMLVNDFRSIVIMGQTGYPVVYDATHSAQMPGGKGTSSGGDTEFVLPLSMAAIACGADALFLEVHESPGKALSDGANMLKMDELEDFIMSIKKIEKAVRH